MTAASEDASLGLNLVFSAPSAVGGTNSNNNNSSNINNKTPKRKTKYDRRRERGRLAKLTKDGDEKRQTTQQQIDRVDKKEIMGGGGSLAGIAAALSGGVGATTTTIVRGKKTAPSSPQPPSSRGTNESTAGGTTAKKVLDTNSNDDDDTKKETTSSSNNNDENIKETTADDSNNMSNNEHLVPKPITIAAASPIVESIEDTTASSRRHRAQTLLTDEQQTQYYSEFHARPRDLDRSECASRDIKVSCASDHIFGKEEGDDNDDNDDDGKDDLDENMGRKAKEDSANDNKSSSSCPFQKLGLHSNLISTLTSPTGKFKLSQPTIVQSRSIAALLSKKNSKRNNNNNKKNTKKLEQNLFIQSETGSGKTLAYLLPILQHLACVDPQTQTAKRIDRHLGGTRSILLCPTRELATQTFQVASSLCSSSYPWIVPGCFSGGEKRKSEKARLRKGISILIATPGRLLDHLSKTESLLLSLKNKLEWLVLDEADRLLDAGLGGQVEQIIQYLRSNQPGAGPKRDGVTWRSVLVSATVTKEMEGLARTMVLGGGDGGWMWARGHVDADVAGGLKPLENEDNDATDNNKSSSSSPDHHQQQQGNANELDNAAPRQLAQLYMVIPAKLRLSSLIAFLSARASKGERTVVFLSTCDSVDYHHALFTAMDNILGSDDNDNDDANKEDDDNKDGESNIGIFGKKCPIYKLHGDIPHNKRQTIMKAFISGNNNQQRSASILLATDVAARGLNFPSLDWIVQYDPPCETKDYVHRAGRSARAGEAGHALLFLLPSERQYVEVLQLRGLKEISALSLSSTLTFAAEACRGVSQEGEAKTAGNTYSDGRGEAFTTAIQNRLEQCILQNDVEYKASIEKKFKGDPKMRRKLKKKTVGPLLEGARKAFSAFVRAYPAKEKVVRHIFNARALHLGHIARSLALKETPKMVSKGNSKANKNKKNNDIDEGDESGGKGGGENKRKSRLAFGDKLTATDETVDGDDAAAMIEDNAEQARNLSLLGDAIIGSGGRRAPAKKKLKSSTGGGGSGGGGGRDVRKRMMEAAVMMQAQEFM